jgi:hypothetical protein
MAAWIKVFPNFVVFGASMFGLLAGLVSIILVWVLLDDLKINSAQKLLITSVLVFSNKLWLHDMGGMETPLVICAMIATYLMLVRDRSIWAGLFSGILLWLRVDGIVWFIFLFLGSWIITRKFPIKYSITTIMVYLPWCIFALAYFGSPVPYTIYAKWVAYHNLGMSGLFSRIMIVLRWMTPVSLPIISPGIITWLAIITVIFSAIGTVAVLRQKWLLILPIFCLEEIVRLVALGETFEARLFIPLFWALMILFGFGIQYTWRALFHQYKIRPLFGIALPSICISFSLWFSLQQAQLNGNFQYYVFDSSLKQLGLWLDKNTPPPSTVILEPLGYAGFFSNRHLIDEVGLVSPQVVALKKQGYSTLDLITTLKPDYAVLHCDDAFQRSNTFLESYYRLVEFNPLKFDPNTSLIYNSNKSSESDLQNILLGRTACYQVWKNKAN